MTSYAEAELDGMEAPELRRFVAAQLADPNAHPHADELVGHGIDRLASLSGPGSLPDVLRDLAADVEELRGGVPRVSPAELGDAIRSLQPLADEGNEAAAGAIAGLHDALASRPEPEPDRFVVYKTDAGTWRILGRERIHATEWDARREVHRLQLLAFVEELWLADLLPEGGDDLPGAPDMQAEAGALVAEGQRWQR